MSYSDIRVLRDKDGIPIPQYYDAVEGAFKPMSTDTKSELDQIEQKLVNLEAKTEALMAQNEEIISLLRQSNSSTIYGATIADRPETAEVAVGAVYMAVSTGDLWQSDGSTWVVL